MKNRISIDVDTEREDSKVKFKKPMDIPKPSNDEEQKQMVDKDIITLVAGLVELISYASSAGLGIKEEYQEFAIKSIKEAV